MESGEYQRAAEVCARRFDQTGDPRAGTRAARALLALGRDDEVLAWADRLRQTDQEAAVLSLRATVYDKRGDTARAAADLQRQLELYRAKGDQKEVARTHYRLFYSAWQRSQFRAAFDAAREAFTVASAAGDEETAVSALEALFTVLREMGDLEGAGQALTQALARTAEQDRERRRRLLVDQGLVRLDENRPALAVDAFGRALSLADAEEDRRFLRSVHLNLVEACLSLGRLDQAEHELQQAWKYAEPDGSLRTGLLFYSGRVEGARGRHAAALARLREALARKPAAEWVWQLEHEIGRELEGQGETGAADGAYERAIGAVEDMRRTLGLDEFKAWLLPRKRAPYEALVRLRAGHGQAAGALQAAERAGARTLLDALVHAASSDAPAGASWLASASDRMSALQAFLPAMSESPVASTRSVEALLTAVGPRHVRVYFDAGDELWLLIASRGRVRATRLAQPPPVVRDLAGRFLADPNDEDLATRLADLLLPSGSLPPPGSPIEIAADGALGSIPFAALKRRGRALVQDHVITLVPSVNAWVALREGRAERAGPPMALGDPQANLAAARQEATEVARLLGVLPHLGAAATLARLRGSADARVLHLATHSGWGPQGPWLSLADGNVTAETIVTGRISPRLVVLATCASGVRRGREMWGSLAAAFLAAGSEAVLASLWSIEDEPARRFVARFYEEGGEGEPSAALARVQRAFIARGEPASVWAPFVLFGSGEGHRPRGPRTLAP